MTSPVSALPLKRMPYWLIVVIFLVVETTGVFEQTMMYVAIPTLMKVFTLDAAAISWAITIFLLVATGTAAISGRLGDLYGRKRVLMVLLALSAVGSFISIIFGTFEGILIGRALQGTSAAIFPLLVGIAREVVPARQVPVLVSLTSGAAIIGGSIAALTAGILLQTSGWHSMFIASGILGIVAMLLALLLPVGVQPPRSSHRLDILGGVLLAPAAGAGLFGITAIRGGVTPFAVGLIVVGSALFVGWIVLELRLKHPMFNLKLFKNRDLVYVLLVTGLIGMGIFSAGGLLNPILQQGATTDPVGLGLTPTEAGLYGLITGAIGFALSPVFGRVSSKFGARVALITGIITAIVGFAGYSIFVHNLPMAVVAMVLTGSGIALVLVGIPNIIVEVVPPANTGEAIGMIYGVGRSLFGAIGTAIAGFILASELAPGTTAPSLSAWNGVLIFLGITAVAALAVTLMIRKAIPMDDRGDVIEAVEEVLEQEAAPQVPTSH